MLEAYALALRQLHEKDAFEKGEIALADLQCWQPGQVIKNRIRVPAGHTVGKTKLSSGIVNHFFDCFPPAIIYTFAPSWAQIKDLLWKEIKSDRADKGLPGEILDLELRRGPDHFAKGRATSDAGGKGTERIHGQHGRYLMFVIDEAEGVANFVYNAIDSMASGGIAIVLMLANPRTRTSRFHKTGKLGTVASLRISCIWHPNVIAGRELVPGGVRREYVEQMIDANCEIVTAHDDDHYTFTLPFPVRGNGTLAPIDTLIPAGTIFKPNPEFMFRILGIAPAAVADTTLVPSGRYEAATRRRASGDNPKRARIGVDVARFGSDYGTVYVEHAGVVRRAAQLWQLDTTEYAQRVKTEALRLAALGVTDLRVRIDGGGGFGGGVVDQLRRDAELREIFSGEGEPGVSKVFRVVEVNFNAVPQDEKAYANLITEIFDAAGQRLPALRIESPPEFLESDLTERTFEWVIKGGHTVKQVTKKEVFRRAQGHSPDDGDGFVLCVAPDHLFRAQATTTPGGALSMGRAKDSRVRR